MKKTPKVSPRLKTPKKTARKSQTPEPIPVALMGMAALIGYKAPDAVRAALAAAREMMAHVGDADDVQSAYERHVFRSAQFGPYRAQVLKAFAVDPGNIEGDLFCALANPALLIGLSVAWLAWRDGGGR